MVKKLYYYCSNCGCFSRFQETYAEAKSGILALVGLLFSFGVFYRERKIYYCLKCGNRQNLQKQFLENEPTPLIIQKQEIKLRYAKCPNDGTEFRWPLDRRESSCPKCGIKKGLIVFFK